MMSADSGVQLTSMDAYIDAIYARASNLSQYTQSELEAAKSWVVRTELGTTEAQIEAATGLDFATFTVGDGNIFLLDTTGLNPQSIVTALSDVDFVDYFYPDLPKEVQKKFIPNDPLFPDQWYLHNIGQLVSRPDVLNVFAVPGEDIRAPRAWETATGQGVVIAIIDDGVLFSHPDLGGHNTANPNPSKYNLNIGYDFSGSDLLPFPVLSDDFHGTAVAGIIGASGNNGEGITGVAYGATLAGIRLLSSPEKNTDANQALAFFLNPDAIDIYNNSWGTPDDVRFLDGPGPLAAQALKDAVFKGRTSNDGTRKLGTIHVFSAGNGAAISDNSNFDGYANSIYTIAVGAVDHTGAGALYSETGSNIHVVAPSAGGPATSGITTTDLPGNQGYNHAGINNDTTEILDGSGMIETFQRDYLADLDYMSRFGTTSASAAIVSGVIALMLEAAADNGIELTYRDVNYILAKAARKNDEFNPGWLASGQSYFRNPLTELVLTPNGFQQRPVEPRDTSAWVFDGNLATAPGAGQGPGDPIFGVGAAPQPDPSWLSLPFSADGLQDQFFLNAPPPHWVNGAGYTINEAYGHGVIDAAMAVELAANWNTWLQRGTAVEWSVGSAGNVFNPVSGLIPAAEVTLAGLVPGGIGGQSGFADFFNEFFNLDPPPPPPDGPFNDLEDLPQNTRGGVFSFNLPRTLEIETLELTVDINVDPEEVDHLRIALMSPDGTVTEFNNWVGPNDNLDTFIPEDAGGNLSWTFSTTRFLGEKGTKDAVDLNPGSLFYGLAVQNQPWRLIIENYSLASEATINSFSVNAYGKQVAPGRIQGFVGFDVDGDGAVTFPDDPAYDPFFVVDQVIPGAIVWLDVDNDGVRDANEPWQITGNDGNYYFDIPFNTAQRPSWQVGIEIPAGFEDLLNPGVTDVILSGPIVVGTNVDPAIPDDQIRGVSFQLSAQSITISGTAYADINLDGNSTGDPRLAGRTIYVDLNENGVFNDPNNPFEPTPDLLFDVTDTDGTYSISANLAPGYYTIAIAPENGVVPANPAGGFYRVFLNPGDNITLDFGTNPTQGMITGYVFFDTNGNGIQDPGEVPTGGFEVYVDFNNDGSLSLGEPRALATAEGGFAFTGLPFNDYAVRILPQPGWEITAPVLGGSLADQVINVEINPGGAVTGLVFGVKNTFAHDYGDLPVSYNGSSPAKHGIFPGYSLGKLIDGEAGPQPTADASGDNMQGMQDEDGVLNAGSILVEANQPYIINLEVSPQSLNLLFLQGWVDYNNDGDFDDPGEHLQFLDPQTGLPITRGNGNGRQITLTQTVTQLMVMAPANILTNELAARFRYSEAKTGNVSQFNKPNGTATFGEVEDYILSAQQTNATVLPDLAGDYDGSGTVDIGDYEIWKSNFGSTTNLAADGNQDGVVDKRDYLVWRNNLGATAPAALAAPVVIESDNGVGAENSPELMALLASLSGFDVVATTGSLGDSGFFLMPQNEEEQASAPVDVQPVASYRPSMRELAFALHDDRDEAEEDAIESLLGESEEQAREALEVALEEVFG